MNRTVREALQRHPKRIANSQVCSLVFSSEKGNPITDVKKGFAGALKRAGIDRHVRFHDLRHTFASHLIMKGVDLRTVAKLMGHRDIEMTMRYAHLAPDHLQAAVDALDTRGGTGRRTGRPMGNCWHGLVQMPVGYEILAGYFSDYLIVLVLQDTL